MNNNLLLILSLNRNLTNLIYKYIDYSEENLLKNFPKTRIVKLTKLKTTDIFDIVIKCIHLGYSGFYIEKSLFHDLKLILNYNNKILITLENDLIYIEYKWFPMKIEKKLINFNLLDIFNIRYEVVNNIFYT